MQRAIRITAAAIVLSAVLSVAWFSYHHSTAQACGSYTVSGSNTHVVQFLSNHGVADIHLSLGYNSCTGDNFTQVTVANGSAGGFVSVETIRSDGANGGMLQCTGNSSSCTDSYIYSPTLKAQACFFTSGGNACTDFF
jgi:hypothetical protein